MILYHIIWTCIIWYCCIRRYCIISNCIIYSWYNMISYQIVSCNMIRYYMLSNKYSNTAIFIKPLSVSRADTDLKGRYGFCRADMNHYRIPFRTFLIISTSEFVRNFRQWFIRHKTLCDLIHALLRLPWI